jgi:hypothetical protein
LAYVAVKELVGLADGSGGYNVIVLLEGGVISSPVAGS